MEGGREKKKVFVNDLRTRHEHERSGPPRNHLVGDVKDKP